MITADNLNSHRDPLKPNQILLSDHYAGIIGKVLTSQWHSEGNSAGTLADYLEQTDSDQTEPRGGVGGREYKTNILRTCYYMKIGKNTDL